MHVRTPWHHSAPMPTHGMYDCSWFSSVWWERMYKHQMWNWDFDLYFCPLDLLVGSWAWSESCDHHLSNDISFYSLIFCFLLNNRRSYVVERWPCAHIWSISFLKTRNLFVTLCGSSILCYLVGWRSWKSYTRKDHGLDIVLLGKWSELFICSHSLTWWGWFGSACVVTVPRCSGIRPTAAPFAELQLSAF